MSTRYDVVHPPQLRRIKLATGALVTANGGSTEAAATLERPGLQPRLSHYGGLNTDAFAPLDVILLLEKAAQGTPDFPHVTRALAREHGFELFRVPGKAAAGTEWGQRVAALFKEVGDVSTRMGEALADDNEVDAAEAKSVLPDAYQLRAVVLDLVAALEAKAGVN